MLNKKLLTIIENYKLSELKLLVEKARREGTLDELSMQIADVVFSGMPQTLEPQSLFDEIFDTVKHKPTSPFSNKVEAIVISAQGKIEEGKLVTIKEGQEIYQGVDMPPKALEWVKLRVNQEIIRDEDSIQSCALRTSLLQVQSVIKLVSGDKTGLMELSQCKEITTTTFLTLNSFRKGTLLAFVDSRSPSPLNDTIIIKCENSTQFESLYRNLNINHN